MQAADDGNELQRHLSAALLSIVACAAHADEEQRRHLAPAVAHLTWLQDRLRPAPVADALPAVADVESEDERIERRAAEASRRVERVLATLRLTAAERAFAQRTGEQLVDAATEAYRAFVRQSNANCDTCIAAAAAVALAIVHDPP